MIFYGEQSISPEIVSVRNSSNGDEWSEFTAGSSGAYMKETKQTSQQPPEVSRTTGTPPETVSDGSFPKLS